MQAVEGRGVIEDRRTEHECIRTLVCRLDEARNVGGRVLAADQHAQEAHETQLRELLGEAETTARMTRMKDSLAAREAGVHRRELFVATPTP